VKRRQATVQRPSPFIRVPEYEGLTPAVDFQVKNEPGWFHFIAFVVNPVNGNEWIDAYGGTTSGQKQWLAYRSFHATRIKRNRKGEFVTRKHKISEPKTNKETADE